MKKEINFSILFVLFFFSSCQTISKYTDTSTVLVQLKPVWVSDTLKKPNHLYRKVNLFSPIVYEENIIAANAFDGLVSYSKSSKSENWRLDIPYGVEASGLLISNTLFVGSLGGVMYSVNVDNGKVNWSFDTKAEITSAPSLDKGNLYFLNGANSIFSLEAATGRQQWVYNRQDMSSKMTVRGASRPSIVKDTVYAGFSDGALMALNSKTGTPLWEITLNKNTKFKDIDSTPVVDNDNIYINSYDDKLYCVSASNGSILWRYNKGGATAPVLVGDKLIFSSSTGQMISLNKKTGDLLWQKSVQNGIASEPLILKGYVIYGESQGKLNALDLLSGDLKASFDPGKGIMSKPSTDGINSVYFISGEANFYQVDLVPTTKNMIPFLKN